MGTGMSPHRMRLGTMHRTGSWFQMETDGKRRVGEPQILSSALRLKNAKFELSLPSYYRGKFVKVGG